MKEYKFGQFTPEHLEAIKIGLKEFNQGHFWMCHEVLEDIWLDSVGDTARYVHWTIIQVAVCLYHWEDGNINGAVGMINKAKRKIEFCEKRYVETEIMEEFLYWSKLKAVVKSIPMNASLDDFKKLSKFKFPEV